ncbi:disintegrin and metalloproteinase domain-containing protein 33-like [Stegostoma tigrinum]|uniref:disintegrin and metalloproteinase domain-containing protein 33-like n=1 Tax=Stegostoma tigrinum TaxID=3053191 RepID=UPI0028704049|nr:disintegrin and metalloproteinase domain-containing protein 33-like [Stegostoma tigrinum]
MYAELPVGGAPCGRGHAWAGLCRADRANRLGLRLGLGAAAVTRRMCPGARTVGSRPTPLQLLLLLGLGLRSGAEPQLPGVTLDGVQVTLYWLGPGHSPQVITAGMQTSCPVWGTVRVNIGDTELVLQIERNNQLIAAAYTETHYDQDGRMVTVSPNQTDHCLYHGHVSGYPHSWLTLTLFSGLSGIVVMDTKNSYYLQPIRQHGSHHHIIYRTEHLPIRAGTCGNLGNNQSDISMIKEFVHQRHRFRRDSWNTMKYVELYLVADHTEFQKQSNDLSRTKARMIEIANYVDKFYRAFNIRIALIGLQVWTHSDQITVSEDATKTLYAFLKWRQKLSAHTKHDNAQLPGAERYCVTDSPWGRALSVTVTDAPWGRALCVYCVTDAPWGRALCVTVSLTVGPGAERYCVTDSPWGRALCVTVTDSPWGRALCVAVTDSP